MGGGQDWSGSGQRQGVGFCEHGNEPSGSIKRGEFYDWLRNWYEGWKFNSGNYLFTTDTK